MNRLSRRRFVTASAAALAAGWARTAAGSELGSESGSELGSEPRSDTRQTPQARLVGTLELGAADGAPLPPFGTLLGEGLDARLFTDLSALAPDRLIVPNERFFVRTARPTALDSTRATP